MIEYWVQFRSISKPFICIFIAALITNEPLKTWYRNKTVQQAQVWRGDHDHWAEHEHEFGVIWTEDFGEPDNPLISWLLSKCLVNRRTQSRDLAVPFCQEKNTLTHVPAGETLDVYKRHFCTVNLVTWRKPAGSLTRSCNGKSHVPRHARTGLQHSTDKVSPLF